MAYASLPILESAEIRADGVSSWIATPTLSMAALLASVESGSGTISGFDLWLQYKASKDDAVAYDVVLDQALKSADAAASDTVRTNVRDLIDAKTTTTAETFFGLIGSLPAGFVRLKWKFSGSSTPKLVTTVTLVGK